MSLIVLFISGCRVETPPITITVDGGTTGSTSSTLSCAATLSPTVTSVIAGQAVPIILQAIGGTGPYTYNLVTNNFSSQITVSETFNNSGSSSSVQSRTYTITDTSGNSASCSIAISVNPTPVTTGALACAFSASTTTPSVGQLVNYGVTVSGGISPYVASNYTPGLNTTYASTLAQTGSSTYASSAIYGASGYKTASVQITDNAGSVTTCSQVVNVSPSPSVTVTATPSATVVAGNPITLTAVANNFSSTPDITLSTTSGGVTFTAVGSTIVVQTTDYSARTVVVDVVASNATQQASASITLTFTASQSLACQLAYPPSYDYYKVGDEITFSVSATSGEALAITSISAQDGTILDPIGGSSTRIKFNSSGYKSVYATARSASTGALCNGGATLTSTLYIAAGATTLSCSAVTSPNPSNIGEYFLARAVVPAGAGVGTVRLVLIQTGKNTQYPYNHAQTSYSYYYDATSSYFAIYSSGSYPVVLTVRDDAGNTATCSTTQVVNNWW